MGEQDYFRRSADRLLLRIRVTPGARTSEPVSFRDGELWFRVAAQPERGKANKELIRTLSRRLGLPRTAVEMASGHGSRHKLISLPAAAAGKLETLIDGLGEP